MLGGRSLCLGAASSGPEVLGQVAGADRCKAVQGALGELLTAARALFQFPQACLGGCKGLKGRHTSWPAEPEHLSAPWLKPGVVGLHMESLMSGPPDTGCQLVVSKDADSNWRRGVGDPRAPVWSLSHKGSQDPCGDLSTLGTGS